MLNWVRHAGCECFIVKYLARETSREVTYIALEILRFCNPVSTLVNVWYIPCDETHITSTSDLKKSKELTEKLLWYQENYDKLSLRHLQLHGSYENLNESLLT